MISLSMIMTTEFDDGPPQRLFTEKDHPMGKKGIEIAFEIYKYKAFMGWMVFQMDMDSLINSYGIDDKNLKKLQFDKP